MTRRALQWEVFDLDAEASETPETPPPAAATAPRRPAPGFEPAEAPRRPRGAASRAGASAPKAAARPDSAARPNSAARPAPGEGGAGAPPAASAAPPSAPSAASAATAEPDQAQGAEPAESVEARIARLRGEARAAGFEEGVAHAEAQGQAELRLILADLREAIQDAAHARLEQEAAALAAARRLARALLAGVAPALARRGLVDEIADAAAEALRAPRAGPAGPDDPGLRIRVAPTRLEAVQAALERAGIAAPVAADAALSDLAARLEWGGGEDALDLDGALAAARAALDRHLPDPAGARDAPAPSDAPDPAAAPDPASDAGAEGAPDHPAAAQRRSAHG